MVYSLTIILLVLVLDRVLPDRGTLNPFSWFEDWAMSVEQRFNGGEARHGLAALTLTVGSVFLVVLLLQALLAQMNWLFRLGFDLLVMYFFVQVAGKLELARNLSTALLEDDRDQAETAVATLTPLTDEPVSDVSIPWTASVRLLAGANDWFFAPVFWFLLAGPAGAVLYYLSGQVMRAWNWRHSRFQEFGRPALLLYQGMSWVPVRILAVGYALLGDFEHALKNWKQQQDTWSGNNDQLLATIGFGALGEDEDNRYVDSELINRAVALEMRVIIFLASSSLLVALINLVA